MLARGVKIRVADPAGFNPDPDPEKKKRITVQNLREKNTDPDPTLEKTGSGTDLILFNIIDLVLTI